MKIDLKKGAGYVGNTIGKAAEIGKKAADNTKSGAQLLADKAQEENRKSQMKKYNPVFPDQYTNPNFGLSNLIMIVDDAVRKDVDVCKGAIGWKTVEKGVEVFHLYDEDIEFSGLHFTPSAVCDAIYYVDPHDRCHYIQIDYYLEKMQESKLAELQHIAFSLGAKKYSVEMYDASSEQKTIKQKSALTGGVGPIRKVASASIEKETASRNETQRESIAYAEFSGDMKPTQPNLQWFSHDDNIKNLIHMRCTSSEQGEIKTYNIELKGTDFASMGVSTAVKLDAAVKRLGFGSSLDLQSKTVKERHQKMNYHLEF